MNFFPRHGRPSPRVSGLKCRGDNWRIGGRTPPPNLPPFRGEGQFFNGLQL